jgi:LysR family hydrogen peroxide-inducible transcriptional activator
VTQPGLSAQFKQLEETLGVQLLERGKGPVLLTAAGRAVLERARVALQAAHDVVATANSNTTPLSGPLRMGVIPTIAPYWLPRTLPMIRKKHPALKMQLVEDQTDRLIDELRKGELDLALLALEADALADSSGLHTLALAEDPFRVAVPAAHRLATRKRLREADLVGEPVFLLQDGH